MSEYQLLNSLSSPSQIKEMSYAELDKLASEMRGLILEVVSKNGGHLASNLGVVELTIALLRFCNPFEDRILWDVSHQCYPFKLLTGRFAEFNTLRTFGGLSGFTKPDESIADAFIMGHASTSISAGFGIASADYILGKKRKVVSIIGDGAMTGGMAFEALNNLGCSQVPMVVILNDNNMSIGHNVGGLSNTLSRMLTGEIGLSLRQSVRNFLKGMTYLMGCNALHARLRRGLFHS